MMVGVPVPLKQCNILSNLLLWPSSLLAIERDPPLGRTAPYVQVTLAL